MDQLGKEIVRRWFETRFAKRDFDGSYFQEWIERFETGHPWTYMDQESRQIYHKIIDDWFRS